MANRFEPIGIIAILMLVIAMILFVPEMVGAIDIQDLETASNSDFSGGTETFIQITPIFYIILLFLLAYMMMDGRGDGDV